MADGSASGPQGVRKMSASDADTVRPLILPWPARILHPNARTHWGPKAKATKAAKAEAWALAKAGGFDRVDWLDGPLFVWITFYPPDRRHRDADGLLSSMKAALDGIALAMGVNDRRFVPRPYVSDEVRKGGQVRVQVTGGPE